MPELPEVETMRRGILPIVASRIKEVRKFRLPLKSLSISPALGVFRRRTVGSTVLAVERLGKRVVVRLDTSDAIVFEPRMTGLVLLNEAPDNTHLRFSLELSGPAQRLFYWDRRGLGSVQLWRSADLATKLGPNVLGPDALAVSASQLRDCLGNSRREIKISLLDQSVIAGIGNLYASEILHLARLNPQIRCCRLTQSEWARLQAAILEVLAEAIRYEGSTLSDGTYRNALNQAGNYQNHHRVYAKAGELCKSCHKERIVRIIQSQRSTFFCPRCQKPTPA